MAELDCKYQSIALLIASADSVRSTVHKITSGTMIRTLIGLFLLVQLELPRSGIPMSWCEVSDVSVTRVQDERLHRIIEAASRPNCRLPRYLEMNLGPKDSSLIYLSFHRSRHKRDAASALMDGPHKSMNLQHPESHLLPPVTPSNHHHHISKPCHNASH